jgi:hypothetical protein
MGTTALWARPSADPFLLPQAGVWFGPVTPVYTTYGAVSKSLGGGIYARVNLGTSPFKISYDLSYQKHDSKGVNGLMLVPNYGSLLYRLPFDSLISYQLRLGVGGSYVRIYPYDKGQWDPLFVFGAEMSFPAGTIANIGLRIDYLLLAERLSTGAKRDGHIVNAGITMNFNLNLFE